MSQKQELEKGLTTKALVVGIIASVVITLWGSHPTGMFYSFRDAINAPPYGGAGAYLYDGTMQLVLMSAFMFVILLIISIVNSVKPTFSRSEVSVIATMIMISGLLSGFAAEANTPAPSIFAPLNYQFATHSVWAPDLVQGVKPYLPQWFWNVDYIAQVGTTSTLSINWAIVAPPVLWNIGFWICFMLTFFFFMLHFRRLWVDTEDLLYPTSFIHSELVLMTQSSGEGTSTGGKAKIFKAKWFWIAFLIMFVWECIRLVPWLPQAWDAGRTGYFWVSVDPYVGILPGTGTVATGINIYPQFDLTSQALLPWVPLVVYAAPWVIGWTYLLSLDVLVGCLIGWLAIWVIWPASVYPSIFGAFTPRHNRWMHDPILIDPEAQGYTINATAIEVGLLAALAIIPIVRNRKVIIPILLGLFKEPENEVDPDRPLPYRLTSLLFIVFFVLSIGFAYAISIHPVAFLLVLVLYLWFMIGQTRLYAESGAFFMRADCGRPALGHWGCFVGAIVYGLMPFLYTTGLNTTNLMTCTFLGYFVLTGLPPIVPYGESATGIFALAKRTKTYFKDVFKAGVIATIAFTVVYFIYTTILSHLIIAYPVGGNIFGVFDGLLNNTGLNGVAWELAYGPTRIFNYYALHPEDYWIKAIAGAVVGVVIVLLRDKLSWFRVSLAGLTLGVMFGEQIWMAVIISLIAKYLTLRVGGAKLYQEKGVPIALGFFFGYMMAWFILGACLWPIYYMVYKYPYNSWLHLAP